MKKTVVKILNIIVTVLIVLVLVTSALVLVLTFTSKSESDGVPNLFGKAPVNVLTDSMKGDGELNFNKGDLLICNAVTGEDRVTAEYKKGDVVTFPFDIDSDGMTDLVTHRIYKVNKDGTYQTKGDNNETFDQDESNSIVFPNIQGSDILAIYTGTKLSGVGDFLDYIRSQEGFFLVILLPMIIFFLYTAVRVVMNIIAYSKEKAVAAAQAQINSSDLTEEQKKRAIEEYLAQQSANAPPETPEAPEIPEAPEVIEAPEAPEATPDSPPSEE